MTSTGKTSESLRDTGALILRVALGVIFAAHGGQKLGLFGGPGSRR